MSNSSFGSFKYVFYIDNQVLTVSQNKETTNLLINKKPFYSFQDLPEDDTYEKSKGNPSTSLDDIEINAFKKDNKPGHARYASSQNALQEAIETKEKARKVTSHQVLDMKVEDDKIIKKRSSYMKNQENNNFKGLEAKSAVLRKEEIILKKEETKHMGIKNNDKIWNGSDEKPTDSKSKEEIIEKEETIKEEIIIKKDDNIIKKQIQNNEEEEKAIDHLIWKDISEEIIEEMTKMENTLKKNINKDRFIKDMEIIQRNSAKMNVFTYILYIYYF